MSANGHGKSIARVADLGGWMNAMRQAVFESIDAGDIAEITTGIVERAKKGDIRAAEFLFRYVVGSPAVKVQQNVHVTRDADGPGPIDVTERRPEDPGQLQIALAARRIKAENLAATRNGKG